MADFCAVCTPLVFTGVPEAADGTRNDFVGWLGHSEAATGTWAWGLCEECGLHLFDNSGGRRCGTGPCDTCWQPCLGCHQLAVTDPGLTFE